MREIYATPMKKLFTIILLIISIITFGQPYLKKGDILKDFSFQTLNGETVNIEELRGKVIYINFFATWCKPCIKELELIQEQMLDDLNDDDFYFVALGRGHTANELEEFKTTKTYTFRMGLDTDKSRFNRFSKKGIPHNIIIDKDGKIIYSESGFSVEGLKKIKRKIRFQLWF